MPSQAFVYQRTEKSDDNPFGLLETQSIPHDECCVVYLGGDGSVNDKAANGYAKIIENEILKPLNLKVPVYSVKYDFSDSKQSFSRQQLFNKYNMVFSKKLAAKYNKNSGEEENNPQYIEDLYKKVIEPRISQNGGKTRLDAKEAARRLRKITFVAHCHGGFTALKLEEFMQKKMNDLGYSLQESSEIQKQMFVAAHAPGSPLGVSKSTFVSFMSAADGQIPQPNNYFSHYINKRMQEESRRFYGEEDQDQEKISQNSWFDLKPSYLAGKQGNFFLIKQKHNYTSEGPAMINSDEHNDVSYTAQNQTKAERMMAHFSKTIIGNAIRNSLRQEEGFQPLPPLEELVMSHDLKMKDKEKLAFEKMTINGETLQKEIYAYARQMRAKGRE